MRTEISRLASRLATSVLVCLAACAAPSLQPTSAPAQVQPGDLDLLQGAWDGSLTYKDYSSGRTTNIRVKAEGALIVALPRELKLRFAYPDEPGHEHEDDYTISDGGRTVGGAAVVERSMSDGTLRLVLEDRGKDGKDERPATLHHVVLLGRSSLVLTKLVRYDGDATFFERNSYHLAR